MRLFERHDNGTQLWRYQWLTLRLCKRWPCGRLWWSTWRSDCWGSWINQLARNNITFA